MVNSEVKPLGSYETTGDSKGTEVYLGQTMHSLHTVHSTSIVTEMLRALSESRVTQRQCFDAALLSV